MAYSKVAPTDTATPCSTPKPTTPTAAKMPKASSMREMRARRMKALASKRLAAASSKMADSTACGSQYSGALNKPTTIAKATAALTLTSGDEPPATSPTAVRESAPVTTKP
ncbi:hypothetical protein D3C87_1488180 [compost metagenome]